MELSQARSLDIMKHCFPSWSDIRKRTQTSAGGSLLMAYAKESEHFQEAIDAYKSIFFLVNYKGREDEIPDYLYGALVGEHDDMQVISVDCRLTEDRDEFLKHPDTMALHQNGVILFHEKLLPAGTESITYAAGKNQYTAEVAQVRIWNAFDEFAKFAGLERYDGERNKELAARTYAVFQNFPNPTEEGLKRAIANAVVPFENITPAEIRIEPINAETLDLSDEQIAEVYERFVQFNHDLFRTKVWNQDTWEHSFQKQGYLSHAWDKPMAVTQDGVGYNDSLRVDYMRNLDTNGRTDVEVYGYKKDFETVKEYVAQNNVEDSIPLTLSKYGDAIEPKQIEYAIRAYDVRKLEHPENIYIRATKKSSGKVRISLADIVTEMHGVEREDRGFLDSNQSYRLVFEPQGDFSSMTVSRCVLHSNHDDIDLRKPQQEYVLRHGVLANSYVRAHVTTTAGISRNDNIIDSPDGMTIGPKRASGSFNVNVDGMDNEMVSIRTSCREIDITDMPYVERFSGFRLSDDHRALINEQPDGLGSIVVGGPKNPMWCNSFSFSFDSNPDPSKQGSIRVIITADGSREDFTYTHGGLISRTYDKRTQVQIVIQKEGQNPVTIRNIRMSSYDIQLSMTNGEGLSQLGGVTRLPDRIAPGAQLHVEIVPYNAAYPAIESVHIGGSLNGAAYTADFDTYGCEECQLDILTDCKVSLYRQEFGKYQLVGLPGEYSTQARFYNEMDEVGQLIIGMEDFVSIVDSTVAIHHKYRGTDKTYINVMPGESLDTIEVTGDVIKQISNQPITDYLFNGDICNWDVYVTKAGNFMLGRHKDGAVEKISIRHEKLGYQADSFAIVGLPDGISPEFVYDDGDTRSLTDAVTDSRFDSINLTYNDAKAYIAYNSVSMISESRDDVEISNTFNPLMSLSELHYYELEQPLNADRKTRVTFSDGRLYAFGMGGKTLHVETELPAKNRAAWPIEVKRVENRFILSNEIPLGTRCLVEGTYHELQEYMIQPPRGIEVHYELAGNYAEEVVVPASKITKLQYSNAMVYQISLVGEMEDILDYEAMNEEGIVVWTNDKFIGRKVTIKYTLNRPSYLTFTKAYEGALYKLVSYQSDAYKLIGQQTVKNLQNGDSFEFSFKEKADHIITECSNPAFEVVRSNGLYKVAQVRTDGRLAVHNGYIYDSGREYYYFNDKFQDHVEQVNSIEFHNVSRQRDEMLFHMSSRNFMPHSDMEADAMAELCHIDFRTYQLEGVSQFNHLTSCDSYNLWYTVGMDVSIHDGGLAFRAKNGTGYAVMDVTRYIRKGNIISLAVDGDLTPNLVRETLVDGMPFARSIFLNLSKGLAFHKEDGFCSLVIEDEPEEGVKYYLTIMGTKGTMDDLISMPFTTMGDMRGSHVKNIDRLGLRIEEHLPRKFRYDLDFTDTGAAYEDVVCSRDGEISTASSVAFGLTRAASVNLTDCLITGADYRDGAIISVEKDAFIKSRPFFLKASASVYAAYIKVNEIVDGRYAGFDISVYGADLRDGDYVLLRRERNANMVELFRDEIYPYLFVEITADKSKVITSVELYARYAELGGEAELVPTLHTSGSFISKVYDLGTAATYRFDGVDDEVETGSGEVQYFVRGLREKNGDMVFTEWKPYLRDDPDMVFGDYRLFQFRADIRGEDTVLKIKQYRMVVAE